MKTSMLALGLVLAAGGAAAATTLPALGYYKSTYSADHGSTQCAQVTSNTKQVKYGDKKLTYFEAITGDGVPMVCIPQTFIDTDDADVDGDPTGLTFVSGGTAFCTSNDGKLNVEVSFDAKHVFWGGESYSRVKISDLGLSALVKQKERQTSTMTFASTTGCN